MPFNALQKAYAKSRGITLKDQVQDKKIKKLEKQIKVVSPEVKHQSAFGTANVASTTSPVAFTIVPPTIGDGVSNRTGNKINIHKIVCNYALSILADAESDPLVRCLFFGHHSVNNSATPFAVADLPLVNTAGIASVMSDLNYQIMTNKQPWKNGMAKDNNITIYADRRYRLDRNVRTVDIATATVRSQLPVHRFVKTFKTPMTVTLSATAGALADVVSYWPFLIYWATDANVRLNHEWHIYYTDA